MPVFIYVFVSTADVIMETFNILLIDEQPVMREGLESFLVDYSD